MALADVPPTTVYTLRDKDIGNPGAVIDFKTGSIWTPLGAAMLKLLTSIVDFWRI
jgi:hypothetical protein